MAFSEVADEVEKDLGEKLKLREYSPKTYTDYFYRLNSVVTVLGESTAFHARLHTIRKGRETAVQTSRWPPKRPELVPLNQVQTRPPQTPGASLLRIVQEGLVGNGVS